MAEAELKWTLASESEGMNVVGWGNNSSEEALPITAPNTTSTESRELILLTRAVSISHLKTT